MSGGRLHTWERLAAEIVYECRIFALRRDRSRFSRDNAEHEFHARVGFPQTVAVDDCGPVRPQPGFSARAVRVRASLLARRAVVRDHAVDVPGCDPEAKPGLPKLPEVLDAVPPRLGDDPGAEAGVEQHPRDDRGPERGVVDIGVAADDDNVAGLPPERIQLLPAHRREFGRQRAGVGNQECGSATGGLGFD